MALAADIAGFKDAQVRLREQFGHDVPFYFASASTWPPGTPMDPETGLPYDPTILPVASGRASAVVSDVSVVHRPLGLSRRGVAGEDQQTAVGVFEDTESALIIGADSFVSNGLADAEWCRVHEEEWEITSFDADSLGETTPQRYVLYIRKR